MIWTVWLLIVLAGTWIVSLIEDYMEKEDERKRNEEIHRMLVSDIERSLNDIHGTGKDGLNQ